MLVHLEKQAQIQDKAQVRSLIFHEVFIAVSPKYFNYSNIFLAENVAKLPENTRINNYTIKLDKSKQLLFDPIYSLRLVELNTIKTYIKTNLTNNFI